jgi:hypothetical protein
LTLDSSSGIFDLTGVTNGDKVDILLSLEVGVNGDPIGPPNHSFADESTGAMVDPVFPFLGKNLFTSDSDNFVASTGNTAQVQTAYTLFGGGETDTNAAAIDLDSNNGLPALPSADIAANELLLTIEGDLNGIDEITASNVENDDGDAGEFTINDDKDAATVTNAADIVAGDDFGFDDLVATIDGETTQAARTLSLEVTLDGDSNYAAHSVFGPVSIIVIDRNGTFFTTNSTGPANRIKITDTSGSATSSGGEITVDCFDAAGMPVDPVDSVELPEKVESNATVTIEGADLTAYCPLGVRFDFTVNTEEAAISNVKRSAEGSVLTVYGNGSGGNL